MGRRCSFTQVDPTGDQGSTTAKPEASTGLAMRTWQRAAGAFTKVGGQWMTPGGERATKEDTLTSEWVGLDGWSAGTVEQDGTFELVLPRKRPPTSRGTRCTPLAPSRWEPRSSPATRSAASVTRSGTVVHARNSPTPRNTANSFTESATCALTTCLDTSAEWIAERPEFSIGIAPLANYDTWTLTNGTQTSNGRPARSTASPGPGTLEEHHDRCHSGVRPIDGMEHSPVATPSPRPSRTRTDRGSVGYVSMSGRPRLAGPSLL